MQCFAVICESCAKNGILFGILKLKNGFQVSGSHFSAESEGS